MKAASISNSSPSTPARYCLVCRRQYDRPLSKSQHCLMCEILGLKGKKFRTVEPPILVQLGVSWIGRYYSTLDPKVVGRFFIRKKGRKSEA